MHVTGETARNIDDMKAVNGRMPWVFGIVLSLSSVLLLLAFRSLVVSATGIATNLLSVGAALPRPRKEPPHVDPYVVRLGFGLSEPTLFELDGNRR